MSNSPNPSPSGAARIAFSYLATLLGLVVMGLVLAVWYPLTDTVCGVDSNVVCGLGWMWGGAFLGITSGVAITARVFGMGWEWWLAVVAGVLALPAVTLLSGVVVGAVVVLWPGVAGALTWSGTAERPRWRPWLIIGLAVALLGASLAAVLV